MLVLSMSVHTAAVLLNDWFVHRLALLVAALLDRTIYLVHQMNAHLLVAWDEIDAERAMHVVESTHLLAVITSMTVRSLMVGVIVFALM